MVYQVVPVITDIVVLICNSMYPMILISQILFLAADHWDEVRSHSEIRIDIIIVMMMCVVTLIVSVADQFCKWHIRFASM